MVNSQDDTGAESEGYKKQTPTSTNPLKQISIQVIPKTDNSETTPPKEKPKPKSTQPPKHKRTAKSPKEPHTNHQNTNQLNFKVESGW